MILFIENSRKCKLIYSNFHSLLLGMQNGAATLQDSLAVSYEIEYALTMQPISHAVWYLPK